MGKKSIREYVAAILGRYKGANRKYKKLILDEFCRVCGFHRKHAIRLLNRKESRNRRKPGRPSVYGDKERKVLESIWLTANRPCSIRLQAMISLWLPYYEKEYGAVDPVIKNNIQEISSRTLDRLMKPVRRKHGSRGKCGTRPGTLLKNLIPIKTNHADVNKPGVIEADTVAHCGNSLEGDFVWSLTMTDIFSGWTANRAVWNKGYEGVKAAITEIEGNLPFRLAGFHSDNGGEFLNYHLIRYFHDRQLPIDVSRSRPSHKNDTAHVEQKNNTHVRLLLGYQRIEDPELISLINRLYEAWGLLNNLFSASLKLIEKKKFGSHYIKKYDYPKTPCQRLIESPDIDELKKTFLTELSCNCNPYHLKRRIDRMQRQILSKCR
jgi:hypothetical protein